MVDVIDVEPEKIEQARRLEGPTKKIDKNAIIFGLAFALIVISAGAYWIPILYLRVVGSIITLATGIYTLFQMKSKLKYMRW